jgi:hypothetical protein
MEGRRFTELPRVPVRVGPSSRDGSLVPHMSGGLLMLGASVPEGTTSPIGVTVDGLVVLDALDDGTVFQVEVLLPRPRWRRSRDSVPTPPSAPESGSIVIADPGPSIFVERLSPRLTIDTVGNRLHVQLERADGETRWVALSAECFALLNGGFLAGFVAPLPP